MRIIDRILLASRILRWRLTWSRRDLDYRPPGDLDARFMTAREAARLVPDGACCLSTGMAGNARCSTLFWAIRENFSGHVETTKSLLALADAGKLELHVLPQGEMCFALEAQADGDGTVLSTTGVGTVLDPRCGRGSAVTPDPRENFIEGAGDRLHFRLPALEVAVIAAPWADAAGNIYFHDAATITENVEAARAAKANTGRVLVSVAGVIPADPPRIGLPAALVDAVVVNPQRVESSAWMFRHYRDHLDATVLGFLEVDAAGNVNVSKRGPRFADYVGPGGLSGITASARTCIFVGTSMQGAQWRIEGGRMVLEKAGRPKLIDTVSEITFSGREALKAGKQAWYVTTVGAFRLTDGGLVLEIVMPGLDVERDIRPNCGVRFGLPAGGPAEAPASILSGLNYALAWGVGARG